MADGLQGGDSAEWMKSVLKYSIDLIENHYYFIFVTFQRM